MSSTSVPVGSEAGTAALHRLTALAARLLKASSAHAVVSDEVPVEPVRVADASTDERVAQWLGCGAGTGTGQVGAFLGVPLAAAGHAVGVLCVFDALPRAWTDADVALLEEFVDPVMAELEVAASTSEDEAGRVIGRLATEAAGIGNFDWDVVTGALRWDDRALELLGHDRYSFDGTIESFNSVVHPDDLARVNDVLQAALADCGDFAAEYRVVLPDGRVRWIASRGRALCDENGTAVRFLGAAFDATAVREGEARVARVLETMPTAFYSLDAQWRFSYVNVEAERLLGAKREALIGGDVWTLYPAAVGSEIETCFRRAVETGEPVTFDAFYPAPLDGWYELRAWPTAEGLSVYFVDITARRAARDEVEQAAGRSALLARVAGELTDTLDAEEGVGRLAPLLVPALADWCVVTLVNDNGHTDRRRQLRDAGSWHVNPDLRPLVERYAQLLPTSAPADNTSFAGSALRSGESIVIHADARAVVSAVLTEGEARSILERLDPASVAVVPLRGRGRIVGLITVFRGQQRATFSTTELDTLGDIAARTGLALDNAHLFEELRDLAEGLQRSMLTAPPEPDHMQVVVRYEPAAQAAQVGGDWYDAFLQRSGDTVLVIGDVVGHDTAAAAAMGQVRSILRAIAVHTGDGPAEVLRGVDRAMETLQADTTATAVVARLEQNEDERSRGVSRLRWSNAGHPPPMVINPDHSVTPLEALDSELLLGLEAETDRDETVVTLDRGATVLLYTDGLVERRDQFLDEGLKKLRETLADLAPQDLTLDQLCDEVLGRMLPDQPDDDVALVAVRLHRQDRPRPAEAGPNRVPPNVPPPR